MDQALRPVAYLLYRPLNHHLRHRLRQLQTWHDKARGLIPLAKILLQLDQVKTSFSEPVAPSSGGPVVRWPGRP